MEPSNAWNVRKLIVELNNSLNILNLSDASMKNVEIKPSGNWSILRVFSLIGRN
jgi:hypothetical protein